MPVESLRIRVRQWLQERLPLAPVRGALIAKTVPLHGSTPWYYLGSVILIAFAVLLVTGPLLAVFYNPVVADEQGGADAYASVCRIVQQVPHGWFIRSLHHWAAHLMIAALLAHLASTLMMKAYRRPRELIWWTGLLLVGLTLAAGFTGYLLPWTTLSFAATRVGAGIAGATPLLGPLVRSLLLGGPDVGDLTLPRFYTLHVTVVPILLLMLIAVHTVLMVYHGSSVPPSVAARGPSPRLQFWPEFIWQDGRVWLVAGVTLCVVAYCLPPGVSTRADLLAPTPAGIKPEWYFLAPYQALILLPDHVMGLANLTVAIAGLSLVGLVLVMLPLLDAPAEGPPAARRRLRRRGRLLLIVSALLAWAVALPLITFSPLIAGSVLCGLTIVMDRLVRRRPHLPATCFGVVLISALLGYTLWPAFGASVAMIGVAVLGVALALIRVTQVGAGGSSVLSMLLLVVALGLAVPLGMGHAPSPAEVQELAEAMDNAVPPDRRAETLWRFVALLGVLVFLLLVTEWRIRYHRRLRALGLFAEPVDPCDREPVTEPVGDRS